MVKDLSKFDYYFLIPIAALTALFLVMCCFFAYNYSDDYLHKYLWEKAAFLEFFDFVKEYYLVHGGRALSPTVLTAWIFTGNISVHMVTLIWLIVHFANCILLIQIVSGQKIHDSKLWLIGGLFFAFSWIGMKTHIGYNVFWATGGYMALSGLVFLTFIKEFIIQNENKKFSYWLLFLAYIGGTLPENASFTLGAYFFALILFLKYKSKLDKGLILYFSAYLCGFAITFFSPGTFQRMEDENFSFSPSSALYNFFDLFSFYLFRNKVLLLFSFFLGCYFSDKLQQDLKYSKTLFFTLIALLVLLVIPFSFMPSMSFVKRSGYFFSFISSGLFFLAGLHLSNFIFFRFESYFKVVWFLVLFSIIYSAYTQFPRILYVRRQIDIRMNKIMESRDKGLLNIEVEAVVFPDELYLVRLLELSVDSGFTDNNRLARYLELESIQIKK